MVHQYSFRFYNTQNDRKFISKGGLFVNLFLKNLEWQKVGKQKGGLDRKIKIIYFLNENIFILPLTHDR